VSLRVNADGETVSDTAHVWRETIAATRRSFDREIDATRRSVERESENQAMRRWLDGQLAAAEVSGSDIAAEYPALMAELAEDHSPSAAVASSAGLVERRCGSCWRAT